MATAVMLYIIDGVEPSLAAEYQSQLLGILGIDKVSRFTLASLTSILFCSYWIRKCHCICTFVLNLDYVKQDKVEDCSKLVMELAPTDHFKFSSKRKYSSIPGSPNGVIDVSFSSDSSNYSWSVVSSVSSSPEPLSKKTRALQSLNDATTDFLCLPR